MGFSMDWAFAFKADKQFLIYDWRLGILRFIGIVAVGLLVIVYQIIYCGNHLQRAVIQGIYRLQVQHPTVDMCNPYVLECRSNFRRRRDLPYCLKSPLPHIEKRMCKYYDGVALRMDYLGSAFLPTRVETFNMNGTFQDDGYYNFLTWNDTLQTGIGPAEPEEDYYVNDVERFTVLFDHSFTGDGGEIKFEAGKMEGFYLSEGSQGKREPIPTLGMKESSDELKAAQTRDHPAEAAQKGSGPDKAAGSSSFVLKKTSSTAQAKPRATLCGRSAGGRHALIQAASSGEDPSGGLRDDGDGDGDGEKPAEETPSPNPKPRNYVDALGEAYNDQHGGVEDPARATRPVSQISKPRTQLDDRSWEDLSPEERLQTIGGGEFVAEANATDQHVFSNEWGDVFSVGKLLKLANISLDEAISGVESGGGRAHTRRARGVSLTVRIQYSNVFPYQGLWVWPGKTPKPYYTYTVQGSEASRYQFRQIYADPAYDPMAEHRKTKEYHGIQILVEQSGMVEKWKWAKVFVILTTALGFMAAVHFVLHHFFINCIPQSSEYLHMKYDISGKLHGDVFGVGARPTSGPSVADGAGTVGDAESEA